MLWLVSNDCFMCQSLAVDIETESKDSHRLLGGLGDDMDGSRFVSHHDTIDHLSFSGLMGGSLSRVTALLASGRSNRQVHKLNFSITMHWNDFSFPGHVLCGGRGGGSLHIDLLLCLSLLIKKCL